MRPPVPAKTTGRIAIRDLAVTYGNGGGPAVAAVSLDIAPGEFVCVLGPSGCGKSTMLNVIAGFVRPTRGQVLIDDELVTKPGADRGMVFQQPTLLPWKTVLDNVALGPQLATRSQAEDIGRTFLNLVGLLPYERHYPSQLSGGMQQRAGIARALANYPRVLLMDEPFGALDAQTRTMMQEALLRIWSEFRTTVVFITHDIDEAVFLADRVVVMSASPGRILDDTRVELPRPREAEMMFSAEFTRVKRRCFDLIRSESVKAFERQGQRATPRR